MTAVSDLLDGLEAAAKAATPGPWTQHGSMIAASGTDTIVDCWEACEDAACIVAEHNAAPLLVAALRGVERLAEELEREAAVCTEEAKRFVDDGLYRDLRGRALAKRDAAASIRGTVADALGASS